MTPAVRTLLWVSAVLLAVYLALRLSLLGSVMTHCDDVGPIIDLIQHEHQNWPRRVLSAWRHWSYAPAQYFLAEPLVRSVSTPGALVFMGRLATFLLWLAGWIFLVWVLLNPRRSGWAEWPLAETMLPLVWVLISWRGIIESSQAHSYAATLLVAVGLCWLACSTVGERLCKGLGGGSVLGAALAGAVALSYQAIFFGGAAWAVIAIEALRRRERQAVRPLALAALIFGATVLTLYAAHLKTYAALRRFPWWAASGYLPTDAEWTAVPGFLAQAWISVLHNLTSIGPWSAAGTALGLLALGVGAFGIGRAARRGALHSVERRLAMLVGLLALIWSAGALLERFPLSPTRHTFVLQVPILLFAAAGLRHLRVPGPAAWSLPVILVLAWAWHLPELWQGIRNQVDLGRVQQALDAHPEAAVVSVPGDCSWDHMLLLKARPSLAPRLFREPPELLAGQPKTFPELLLLSHRGPLGSSSRRLLEQAGYLWCQSLAGVEPQGSTELSGNINGGNGFYLILCRRSEG